MRGSLLGSNQWLLPCKKEGGELTDQGYASGRPGCNSDNPCGPEPLSSYFSPIKVPGPSDLRGDFGANAREEIVPHESPGCGNYWLVLRRSTEVRDSHGRLWLSGGRRRSAPLSARVGGGPAPRPAAFPAIPARRSGFSRG